MGDVYPLSEQDPGIVTNKTMKFYEEENIMVCEEITIQHKNNLVNMEIEEGYEVNNDLNEE